MHLHKESKEATSFHAKRESSCRAHSGVKGSHREAMMLQAVEKSFSLSTCVAGIDRYLEATLQKLGKFSFPCSLQKAKGSSPHGIVGSKRYLCNSSCAGLWCEGFCCDDGTILSISLQMLLQSELKTETFWHCTTLFSSNSHLVLLLQILEALLIDVFLWKIASCILGHKLRPTRTPFVHDVWGT